MQMSCQVLLLPHKSNNNSVICSFINVYLPNWCGSLPVKDLSNIRFEIGACI